MEALELKNCAPTVHLEYNKSCIYFVEAKRVTHRVKHKDIPVYVLQYQFYNDLFIPKYDN